MAFLMDLAGCDAAPIYKFLELISVYDLDARVVLSNLALLLCLTFGMVYATIAPVTLFFALFALLSNYFFFARNLLYSLRSVIAE